MAAVATKTDANADWMIGDDIVRLREWGTDRVYLLPRSPIDECLIGSGDDCVVKLSDDRVSRKHARLKREHGKWSIVDFGSKNGIRQDGARQYDPFVLEPGVEIGIGGLILIAESERSIALRSFCARILGWTTDRLSDVDNMLRSIRLAARMRTALLLRGESDVVPVAHSLHRYTHGDHRPFVLCDPRRVDVEETVRSVANYEVGLLGLDAARGGSLCVRGERPPSDYAAVLQRVREPDARVQLIVCSKTRGADVADPTAPIRVPSLKRRAKEVPRIVDEYLQDAVVLLKVPTPNITRSDRTWIVEHAATTLPEIEKATMRLVALRNSVNIAAAATRLGMAPISLSRWIDRRRPPMRGRPGCDD